MKGALLEYQRPFIQRPIIDAANGSPIPHGNSAVDKIYNKCKRRRLNPPCDVLSNGNVNDDKRAEPDTESQQLRDSVAIDYGNEHSAASENFTQNRVDDNDVAAPNNSSPDILDGPDLDIFNKAMGKIRSAIKAKFTSSEKKKPSSQPQSALKIISQSNTSLRNYQALLGNSTELLERMLFDEAHCLLDDSRQIAWKLRFIASCLRIIRGAVSLSGSGDGREHSEWRWTRSSRIVNSIVAGLWDNWGPKACIIYEVLAGKVFHTSWYNC